MLLLKLLRPGEIPQRKKQWNWQVRWYFFLLHRLLPLYRKCAISDTVHIGETQIIHNVRDYWYEQELQRFHIDVAQHLGTVDSTTLSTRKWWLSRLFDWTELMVVYANGKSYSVSHANTFTVRTDMAGQLKVSTDKDAILRSEYTVEQGRNVLSSDLQDVSLSSKPQEHSTQGNRKTKSKIIITDKIPTEKPTIVPQVISNEVETYKTTQYRGFEENEIF